MLSAHTPGGSPNESTMAVPRLPACEFCTDRAEYLGDNTRNTRRAYMCQRHFKQFGFGVGRGRGWQLVVTPDAGRKK